LFESKIYSDICYKIGESEISEKLLIGVESNLLNMNRTNRRTFLKQTALAVSGMIAAPTIIPAYALGGNGRVAPSDKVRLALIGCGNQGSNDIRSLMRDDRVQVVALCDVNKEGPGYWDGAVAGLNIVEKTVNDFYTAKNGKTFSGLQLREDFRDILAINDLDAVEIALPDHWHSIPVIMAAKAGKAIYCQKPLSLTIPEGRAMSNAVKKYNVVFQTGSQQRSDQNFRFVCELVRNGKLGKIHTVTCGMPGGVTDFGRTAHQSDPVPVPSGFNYDMWLGPAPDAPYCPARVGVNFRWNLDYSGGQITDWGGHHPDIAQWAMGTDHTGPAKIEVMYRAWAKHPVYNTAIHYHIETTYREGFKLIMSSSAGFSGVQFDGEDNRWARVSRGSYSLSENMKDVKLTDSDIKLYESDNHFRNFIDCVYSGKEPIVPVEAGHRSVTLSHLGNIAMILNQDLEWDPVKERFVHNTVANMLLDRPMREPWDTVYKKLVAEL
jgi:predicted dehydrogenase